MILSNDQFWRPSCDSEYLYTRDEHDNTNNKFVFKIKKGVPGKSPGDDLPAYDQAGNLLYNFKERCEATSSSIVEGDYIWSGDIRIEADQIEGNSNCMWQLHWEDGHEEPENYIKLVINEHKEFRIEPRDIPDVKATNLFNLRVEIKYRKDFINVDFYIDNKYLASTRKLITSPPYFKFGVYTLESKCDITHIFYNVKVEYQPVNKVEVPEVSLYPYKDKNGIESYVTESYIKKGEPIT
jgi:hypothetical protein